MLKKIIGALIIGLFVSSFNSSFARASDLKWINDSLCPRPPACNQIKVKVYPRGIAKRLKEIRFTCVKGQYKSKGIIRETGVVLKGEYGKILVDETKCTLFRITQIKVKGVTTGSSKTCDKLIGYDMDIENDSRTIYSLNVEFRNNTLKCSNLRIKPKP